jgi:hypothetical protein
MNTNCEKITTAYSQNILHGDALYNIKRKKHKKVTFDRMVMLFYKTCNVFFICYAVGLLQYSKSVWSKVGTRTIYMLISCIFMPENCLRSGKVAKRTPYSQSFLVLRYLFNIFKLNNAMHMPWVPSQFH